MTEEIKDVNAKVDELEAAAKKYASKDTVISIGGYEFTPAKLMVAFTIVSSILGGLYGCFEVYKDYMGMKDKIAKYVAPDLSELYKKMEVLEANTNKTVEYSQDIKNDLKNDIRRLEGVVEAVERDSKSAQRDTDKSVQDARKDVRETKADVDKLTRQLEKDTGSAVRQMQKENEQEIKQLRRELDDKIKKALDNPLANK
jgi:outer membrane murein-binding lipoprotein Lpp